MTRFSFRGVVYWLIVVLGLLSAVPNLLPQTIKQQLPDWYANTTLALGLDLQGGSHLLLSADTDAMLSHQLNNFASDLLAELRESQVRYTRISEHNALEVSFTLRDTADFSKVKEAAYRVSGQPDSGQALALNLNNRKVSLSLSKVYAQRLIQDAMNRSVDVVRQRLNGTGLTEPSVTLQGKDGILVQMPGVSDPSGVKKLLGTTAQLRFHWQANDTSSATMIREDKQGRRYQLEQKVALEGKHISDASGVLSSENGLPVVTFKLDNAGAKQFAAMTRDNIGRVLAVVLDEKVITAPVINSPIPGGRGEITGSFSLSEAHDVALMLRTGALPVPLSIVEERTVGPDLGSDAIQTGVQSSVAGALSVLVFMVAIYGRWGAIASLALCINMGLVFGILSVFGATLTLPGIAGLILTMGMAVDANILINERIREESKQGRPPVSAIRFGFDKAFATIIDANITTLIAVCLLFMFGSGPVKGFAITIAIGLLSSLFTAVTLTRILMQHIAGHSRSPMTFASPLARLSDKLRHFNFLSVRRKALLFSVVLTLLSVGLFARPGLNYGVDFTGGTLLEVTTTTLDTEALRNEIRDNGFTQVNIQEYGSEHHYLLRAPVTAQPSAKEAGTRNETVNPSSPQVQQTERLKQVIATADNQASFDRVDMVGPKVSGGFAELSILAVLIAGSGMLLYLWGRFEAHFAFAALLTVLLDLTKTIGFFALTGIEFNLTAVAALLALIGYSINDKVVVLDRVRELLRGHPEARLAETINQAVNSTLSRTVFTSLTTLLALLPMALLGGDAVKSFAQPMLFAVVIGTSSSLFITPALLFGLAKRRERLGKAQLKPTAEEIQAELANIP